MLDMISWTCNLRWPTDGTPVLCLLIDSLGFGLRSQQFGQLRTTTLLWRNVFPMSFHPFRLENLCYAALQ